MGDEAIARIQKCLKKPDFSEESGAAPAKPVARCQETARVVESPAGIAALPTADPRQEHGNRTVPLARLLLEHSLININPVSLRNSHCIFQSLRAKRTALPRMAHQKRGAQKYEAWPAPPALLGGKQNPGTSADDSLLCVLLLRKLGFSLGAGWPACGGVRTRAVAHGTCVEPSCRAPALISVPNPMLLCPGTGCVACLVKQVKASLDSGMPAARSVQNKQNSRLH